MLMSVAESMIQWNICLFTRPDKKYFLPLRLSPPRNADENAADAETGEFNQRVDKEAEDGVDKVVGCEERSGEDESP